MKNLTLLLVILTGIFLNTHAQNPQWIIYDTSNSCLPYNGISSIAIEDNGVKWIGAVNIYAWEYTGGNSLVAFNGNDWIIYDTSNSELPSGFIRSIAIDGNSTKWIGIYPGYGLDEIGGLAAFDGSNWTVYDTSNSNLPSNKVQALAIDENGTKWISTRDAGLAAFDGTNWVVYDTSNSDLPSNYVLCIAIDGNGIKWIGTDNGLAAFDGTNWTIYNTSNSDLPSNYVSCLAIDQNETKWMACDIFLVAFDGSTWTTYNPPKSFWIHLVATQENGTIWISRSISPLPPAGGGLKSFDGIDWITYKTNNSNLPDNYVFSIAIDENGTKWIGTRVGGLAAFNENGIPPGVMDYRQPTDNMIIFPNPASNHFSLVIQPDTKVTFLEIINIQGKLFRHYEVSNNNYTFNVSSFPKGLYFVRLHTSQGIEVKKLLIQ